MKPDEATLELLGKLDGKGYEWRQYGVRWREPPGGNSWLFVPATYKLVTFYSDKFAGASGDSDAWDEAVLELVDEVTGNEEIYRAFMEGAGPDSVVYGECLRPFVMTFLMRKNTSQAARSASRVTDIPLLAVERDDEHFLFEVWHRGERAAVCRFEGERRVEWEGFERLPEIAPPIRAHRLTEGVEYGEGCRSEDLHFWTIYFLRYFYGDVMEFRGSLAAPDIWNREPPVETVWKGVDIYCPAAPGDIPRPSEEEIAENLAALDELPTTTLKPIQTFDGWVDNSPKPWPEFRKTEYERYGYIGDLQCYPVHLNEEDEDGTSAFPYFFGDDGSLELLTAETWHHTDELERLGVNMRRAVWNGAQIGRRYGRKVTDLMPDARGRLYGSYKKKYLIEFSADLVPVHRYRVKGERTGWYLNAGGELCFITESYVLLPKDQGDAKEQEKPKEITRKISDGEIFLRMLRVPKTEEEENELETLLDAWYEQKDKNKRPKRWTTRVYRVGNGGGGA